jgi:hypothetical protein
MQRGLAPHSTNHKKDRERKMMEAHKQTQDTAPDLSADLLRGADSIAEFLFGEGGDRRKVYHLAETSRLPVFKLGSKICARKSVLLEWIADQEWRRCAKPSKIVGSR